MTIFNIELTLPCCRSAREIPERLCKFEWLDHDAFLLLVVSDLGVACQWKVFAQRMPIEAIIRHDAPQVWVSDEENAK